VPFLSGVMVSAFFPFWGFLSHKLWNHVLLGSHLKNHYVEGYSFFNLENFQSTTLGYPGKEGWEGPSLQSDVAETLVQHYKTGVVALPRLGPNCNCTTHPVLELIDGQQNTQLNKHQALL
jgi:hypothetical protein